MTTETMTEEASTTGSGATGVPTLLAAGDATLPPMFADAGPVSDPAAETALVPTVDPPPDPDSWRAEVAARLEHYRTRRKPRTPRYPSLLLPFDAPESWSRPAPPPERARMASTGPAFGGPGFATVAIVRTEHDPAFEADLDDVRSSPQGAAQQDFCPAEPAKVIEFPRSAAIPVFRASELADPVFDRPRIVEAPEIFLPPPALGGMLIEPIPAESAERNADAATPSSSASIGRRLLAALVDGSVLAASVAAFVTMADYLPSWAALPWSPSCSRQPMNSCLWSIPVRLPACAPLGSDWSHSTGHRSIVGRAAGACWRPMFRRSPPALATSGACSTRTDSAGMTASPAPTFGR
jgi:hypothetical protein